MNQFTAVNRVPSQFKNIILSLHLKFNASPHLKFNASPQVPPPPPPPPPPTTSNEFFKYIRIFGTVAFNFVLFAGAQRHTWTTRLTRHMT